MLSLLGSLREHSLYELIQRGFEVSTKLKKIRLKNLNENSFFDGFYTCDFCNRYLSGQIKDTEDCIDMSYS